MSRAGPPGSPIVFSFEFVKKPMLRLSGDQNGWEASSVPARGLASNESSARTHNIGPPFQMAVNATVLPSGEMAKDSNAVLAGGKIERRKPEPDSRALWK